MNDVINSEAVGYDNLEKRFADPENNYKNAHESPFDKILADYFI